ncbi:MAG: YkgJ family cysteine cluster protein [Planctomycetota bacterium]|jgi:Fe-S-cluster containining protein
MADWFEDGLRFQCTRCGACCRGEPGYVWVTLEEAAAIARAAGMSLRDLQASCLRRVGGRISLIEKADGDCIFWKDGAGCTVYTARPLQCRTFPFWKENVRSEKAWHHLAERCPGVGHGKRHSADEVRRCLKRMP